MSAMNEPFRVPMLLISGTVGSGKTSVAAEASRILADRQVPHAFVDIDALACSWPERGPFNRDLALKNLASVWANFREAGAGRLIVAGVLESPEDVRMHEEAIPGADAVICRLVASPKTREKRLRTRETGTGLAWHLQRTGELERILQEAALEDFRVENDGDKPLDAVAREVLRRAGWL